MAGVSVEQVVSVKLPTALLEHAADQRAILVPSGTIHEVIDALEERYPGMRFHLCLEVGELRPFVNIFLNGVNIRYLQGLDTPAPAGARLLIVPSVAGG